LFEIPDVVEFVEVAGGVVEDVDTVVAAVEPVRRQFVWKAVEEHSTDCRQLSERRAVGQLMTTCLVTIDQIHFTCVRAATTTEHSNDRPTGRRCCLQLIRNIFRDPAERWGTVQSSLTHKTLQLMLTVSPRASASSTRAKQSEIARPSHANRLLTYIA